MDVTPKSSPEKPTMSGRKKNSHHSSSTLLATTTSLLDTYLHDCQHQPSSPASSSTSQTTGDTTFEPSIDMMVNDFDDEQTLTEEEALAELEAQDPADEIATLQKESEIPLEELLAHYKQQHVNEDYQQRRHKKKKSAKKNRSKKQSKKSSSSSNRGTSVSTTINHFPVTTIDEVIVIEESDDEVELLKVERADTDIGEDGSSVYDIQDETQIDEEEDGDDGDEDVVEMHAVDFSKRSHLLELYPEKFADVHQKFDDDISDDDDEYDPDYIKKTIMVGSAYQATIPTGLSKYGDVLPYENEDKLVWEPSQVSEQEVEDYLIRVREIKSMSTSSSQDEEVASSSASVTSESDQGLGSNVVKDDEQALHLLVQCGYNFKEALRRKRLNAVPLTGSMSLWSEEECRNFEEGIQKFGKDFRKIRQTQVRTRSIRELVQFYYLWKKTDRRDQDFVDSDATDHMDIYLDYDERDTGSNGGGGGGGGGKHVSSSLASESFVANQTFQTKKQYRVAACSTLLNFSIMNDTKRLPTCHSNPKKASCSKKSQLDNRHQASSYRRRSSLLSADKTHHHAGDSCKVFKTKYTPDVSPKSGGGTSSKMWRSNSNATTSSSSSTISSTTGNHCNKK